jgi:hypothetical protein
MINLRFVLFVYRLQPFFPSVSNITPFPEKARKKIQTTKKPVSFFGQCA